MASVVLLAQDAAQIPALNWGSALVVYGPLGAIVAFVGFMIYKFMPRLVEGHLSFLKTTSDQGERTTEAMEVIARTITDKMEHSGIKFRDHVFSNARTNKAMLHLADLILAGSQEIGSNFAETVRPHVEAIKQAINGKEF